MNPLSQNKAWSLRGDVFITSFAGIEKTVNTLFFELIGGERNPPSSVGIGLLLTYALDLRKKLELLQIILKVAALMRAKCSSGLQPITRSKKRYVPFPF